ncbi:MAG: hypothetical protein Q9217_000856 [Psora testacea]
MGNRLSREKQNPAQQSSAPSQPSNQPQPSSPMDQQGVWDTVPQYRLAKETVERYLTRKFGYRQFHIKRVLDNWTFWIPYALSDTLDDIVKKAGEYPKHQTYQDVHPFDLDRYFDQLGALDEKLFHESRRTSFDFWEYSSAAKRTSLGRKLRITRDLLALILSYQQALPQFLDLLFLFARDFDASEFYSIGLRHATRLTSEGRGPEILERGWSGRDIKICYNLKSPECDDTTDSNDWPWNTEQSAVHHSFDVETGQASWIVVKGDSLLKDRIQSATEDGAKPGLSFVSREQGFGSALAIHLIFCDWSRQNWHSYINFLRKQIQTLTKRAKSPLAETTTTLSSRLGAAGLRQRQGTQVNQQSTQVSTTGAATGPNPFSSSQSSAQGAKPATFSLSDLQDSHSIEEIVNNASLNLKVNQDVLSELRAAYKCFEHATGWPTDLSTQCRGDLTRFAQRVTSIQNDMAIQQSRVEALSRLIADRRSLVTRILEDQNISFNIQQAQLAQSSADKMELMTENMENLTQEMHSIAKQTREETISMRIMALIALMFLPGTFTSVR